MNGGGPNSFGVQSLSWLQILQECWYSEKMRQLSPTQILRAGIPSIPWPRKVLVKVFSLGYRQWTKKGIVWPINFVWLLPFWQTFLHLLDAYIFFTFCYYFFFVFFFLLMFCFALFLSRKKRAVVKKEIKVQSWDFFAVVSRYVDNVRIIAFHSWVVAHFYLVL